MLRAEHRACAPSELMIAACAHHINAGVLHYDADYDLMPAARRCASEANGWPRLALCLKARGSVIAPAKPGWELGSHDTSSAFYHHLPLAG